MNKAILMGRLTRDPELKSTQSGISVVSFTLAVDRRFKNQNGEREADFISCKAWRQTAEFIAKWFQKGSMLSVVGSIQTGKYDKDGVTQYTTEVVVDEAYFVGSKSQDGPVQEDAPSEDRTSRQSGSRQGASRQAQPRSQAAPALRSREEEPADAYGNYELPFDL